MQLEKSDLVYLHDLAVTAAKKAGEIIMSYKRSKLKVNSKSGSASLASQVVTEVDLLSEKSILAVLNPSLQKYNLALVTEESTDDKSRFENEYFWCVDPLDGTLPYIENKPGYSIVISLISKSGEACIGVIYNPVDAIMYSAIKGLGAFKDGQPWLLKDEVAENANKTLAFVYDRSFSNDALYKQVLAALDSYASSKGYRGVKPIQYGGAAMNACWLIENPLGCYFKFPKEGGGSIWDYAASACIYKELGLPVSDIFGAAMDLNRKESTYMNHKGILYASNEALSVFAQQLFTKLSNQ